ncbi:MAG: PRC-barrel domain-containing protein [Thioalkalispiraceae bacterium]|jgi:hypothetical protein
MYRKISEITGYSIHATDGDIGHCHDFLFDDRSWAVRYMVAKTAKWLPGQQVIISPVFLEEPDWEGKRFPVRLTKDQVAKSPPLEEHAPVSKEYEIMFHQYYALPFYWLGQQLWGTHPDPAGVIHPVPDAPKLEEDASDIDEGHLRSTEEVNGYHIAASDGEIGHVEDFLIDDVTWAIRYLVVDTSNWLPGRKVLLSPDWLETIKWAEEKVYANLKVEAIKNSPEYDPSQPVNRSYESELFAYYERPPYWE